MFILTRIGRREQEISQKRNTGNERNFLKMQEKAVIRDEEVEILKDELSHYKCENKFIEGEMQNEKK